MMDDFLIPAVGAALVWVCGEILTSPLLGLSVGLQLAR